MNLRTLFLGLLLAVIPTVASAQLAPQVTHYPSVQFLFTANGVFQVNNIDGMSYCSVTVNSGSTMGSGTITFGVNNDSSTTYFAASGAADLGAPGTVAQTITVAGKHSTIPVAGESSFALTLTGATSPNITGTVKCNDAPGAAL